MIYAQPIKNEAIEHELHTRLKSFKNIKYYPINKVKKTEKDIVFIETYVFNYNILNSIRQEIYKMETDYESNILDKKIHLATLEKDTENIKKDKEITLATIEKDKENIKKDKEITLATIEKDTKSIVLETKNKDIEYVKLQIELIKLQKNIK